MFKDPIEFSKKDLFLQWFLVISILMVPFFHYGEVLALLDGSIHNQVTLNTALPVIIFKYVLVLAIAVLAFAMCKFPRVSFSSVENWGVVVLFGMSAFAVLMTDNLGVWSFLAGCRWLLPFYLVFFFIPLIDKALIEKLAYASILMMVLNCIMQLWELAYMSPWWGLLAGTHFAARVPGLFPVPSTSAMFTCFAALLSFFVIEEKRMKWLIATVAMFSVFLTLSGTGFGAMLVILGTLASGSRWRICFPVIVPVSYELTKLVMPYFRGEGYFQVSLGGREDMLSGMSGMSGISNWSDLAQSLFGANFGAGTATAWLLKFNYSIDTHPVMTDSLLAQLVVNLGGIALLGYLLLMSVAALLAYISDKQLAVLWLIVTGFFSITAPITEAFPLNIMLAVAIAYLIRTRCFSFESPLRWQGA